MRVSRETIGGRIRMLRDMLDWTPTMLARQSGVPLSQIYKYETGHGKPGRQNITAIAYALGVSVEFLMGDRRVGHEQEQPGNGPGA